ncbi:MAG TPA: mycofactocin oligosaccharide methyltransferase MftM [Nocardioides sp.]
MTTAGLPDLEPPTELLPAAVDPFRPTIAGHYRDDVVEVRAVGERRSRLELATVRTRHFDLTPASGGRRVRVDHVFGPHEIHDDVAGLISAELFGPGWLRGVGLFERVFTGVVRSMHPDPLASWDLFYGNTLAELDRLRNTAPAPGGSGHGTIAEYAPVYAHTETLLAPGSVLEVGCCFGFFPLRLAASGRAVTASDVSPGTARLLGEVARHRGVPLRTLAADAAHHPGADSSFDNVLVLHLLEHVDADHGQRILDEALRLARRRVIVAVPLEDVAEETWGHVRTVSLDDLRAWGAATGRPFDVHELHGGWLVVDLA